MKIFLTLILLILPIISNAELSMGGGFSIGGGLLQGQPAKKILYAGDSLTNSGTTGNYRGVMQALLPQGEYDSVGDWYDFTAAAVKWRDPDTGGLGGDQVWSLRTRMLAGGSTDLATYLPASVQPHSILFIFIGTNQAITFTTPTLAADVATATGQLEDIIDYAHATNPLVDVYVGFQPRNDTPTNHGYMDALNAGFKVMLDTYKLTKTNLFYADMNAAITNDTYGFCTGTGTALENCINSDGIHTNLKGDRTIAYQLWDCVKDPNAFNCNGN